MKNLFVLLFLAYLRLSARIQLFKIRPKIVALTGSTGKTSLRNAIFSVLNAKYKVKKSVKANSETGIPLDLLNLHLSDYSLLEWLKLAFLIPIKLLTDWQQYDVYVVELGVDDPYPPKNMEYLLGFIKPDVSVFLNVSLVHSEQFSKLIPGSKKFSSEKAKEDFLLSKIAQEKGKIITYLDKSKTAIVNRDDPWVWLASRDIQAKLISFGKNKKADLKIGKVNYRFKKQKSVKPSDVITIFEFKHQNKDYQLEMPFLLPEYYAYTLAAALMVGFEYGVEIEKGCQVLSQKFQLPAGRMNLFEGLNNSLLIDSSYNASKASTLGTLDILAKIPSQEKTVVLGDMRELGLIAKQEHFQVAEKILKTADRVILIGPLTKKYVLPVIGNKKRLKWFENSWQASEYLKKQLKEDSVVLVKGSQNNIFTEIVVEALLKNKKDKARLCRRGRFWQKQRAKFH